jgi:hypothetical protein
MRNLIGWAEETGVVEMAEGLITKIRGIAVDWD